MAWYLTSAVSVENMVHISSRLNIKTINWEKFENKVGTSLGEIENRFAATETIQECEELMRPDLPFIRPLVLR